MFNAEKHLREALASVRSQTVSDFQALIVDDGSFDESIAIAEQICAEDDRFLLLKQAHAGVVAALNLGLEHTQTEFVARMDADDICHPNRLALQLAYLDANPDCAVVGSRIMTIDEEGNLLRRSAPITWSGAGKNGFPPPRINICHPTVMFRTTVIRQCCGYDNNYPAAEDYELWLRVRQLGSVVELPEILLFYRLHRDGVSSQYIELQRLSCIRAELVAFAGEKNLSPDVIGHMKDTQNRSELFQLAEKASEYLPSALSLELYFRAQLLRRTSFRRFGIGKRLKATLSVLQLLPLCFPRELVSKNQGFCLLGARAVLGSLVNVAREILPKRHACGFPRDNSIS